MVTVLALLLDLANIVGGLVLAAALLQEVPALADPVGRLRAALAPVAWVVGVVALAAGGYWLLVHVTDGPHVFHFELVGIGVGVALLWDRLTGSWPGRSRGAGGLPASGAPTGASGPTAAPAGVAAPRTAASLAGPALLLAIFGVVAVLVGIQGLFTPDG
jgi:hypothetical protein